MTSTRIDCSTYFYHLVHYIFRLQTETKHTIETKPITPSVHERMYLVWWTWHSDENMMVKMTRWQIIMRKRNRRLGFCYWWWSNVNIKGQWIECITGFGLNMQVIITTLQCTALQEALGPWMEGEMSSESSKMTISARKMKVKITTSSHGEWQWRNQSWLVLQTAIWTWDQYSFESASTNIFETKFTSSMRYTHKALRNQLWKLCKDTWLQIMHSPMSVECKSKTLIQTSVEGEGMKTFDFKHQSWLKLVENHNLTQMWSNKIHETMRKVYEIKYTLVLRLGDWSTGWHTTPQKKEMIHIQHDLEKKKIPYTGLLGKLDKHL